MSSPPDQGTRPEPRARFHRIRRLGAGGMGVVYEAVDRERDTRVALKTMLEPSPKNLLRLKHEFRALAELSHPNLVQLGELVSEDGEWFFTMELVDGVDFVCWARPSGAVTSALAPTVRATLLSE